MWQDTAKRQQFVLQELGQLKREGFLQQPQRTDKTTAPVTQSEHTFHIYLTHIYRFSSEVLLLTVNLEVIRPD